MESRYQLLWRQTIGVLLVALGAQGVPQLSDHSCRPGAQGNQVTRSGAQHRPLALLKLRSRHRLRELPPLPSHLLKHKDRCKYRPLQGAMGKDFHGTN